MYLSGSLMALGGQTGIDHAKRASRVVCLSLLSLSRLGPFLRFHKCSLRTWPAGWASGCRWLCRSGRSRSTDRLRNGRTDGACYLPPFNDFHLHCLELPTCCPPRGSRPRTNSNGRTRRTPLPLLLCSLPFSSGRNTQRQLRPARRVEEGASIRMHDPFVRRN